MRKEQPTIERQRERRNVQRNFAVLKKKNVTVGSNQGGRRGRSFFKKRVKQEVGKKIKEAVPKKKTTSRGNIQSNGGHPSTITKEDTNINRRSRRKPTEENITKTPTDSHIEETGSKPRKFV